MTAFGPAVNIAARLETMTKQLNTSLLIDAATAKCLTEESSFRTRRLARVLPYGLEKPIDVCELLPPEDVMPTISAADIANYETALDQFIAGDWLGASNALENVSATDRSKAFLSSHISSKSKIASKNWDGVSRLDSK